MRALVLAGIPATLMLGWACTAGAATIVYTDKAAWDSAVGGQFLTEDFDDDLLNPGVSFVSSESGNINPALGIYQDVLASASQNEPMTVWSFTPAITAYGGSWTLGAPGGSGNSLLVYLDGRTFVGSIPNSFNGGFWGFVSDTPFTSVKLRRQRHQPAELQARRHGVRTGTGAGGCVAAGIGSRAAGMGAPPGRLTRRASAGSCRPARSRTMIRCRPARSALSHS